MDSVYKSYLNQVEIDTLNFLQNIERDKHFLYSPVERGMTKAGSELTLGFSCYALKINYIFNNPLKINFKNWCDVINSYQIETGEYIDNMYLKNINQFAFETLLKNSTKIFLNYFGKNYPTKSKIIKDSIRAETKQSISTIFQVNEKNKIQLSSYQSDIEEIKTFLNNLNWNNPWSAGAQFAALSVFLKTQSNHKQSFDSLKNYLIDFTNSIVDSSTGTYFLNQKPNSDELINGAMKVLTGLDWLDGEIKYPERLIDFCLLNKPSHEGCNLVDTVYVLWKSSNQTTYKRKEIIKYLIDVIEIIKLHQYKNSGFSYYLNKSQIYYYGLKITRGYDVPDLHGTVLLVWALSMINKICEFGLNWNTLKP